MDDQIELFSANVRMLVYGAITVIFITRLVKVFLKKRW